MDRYTYNEYQRDLTLTSSNPSKDAGQISRTSVVTLPGKSMGSSRSFSRRRSLMSGASSDMKSMNASEEIEAPVGKRGEYPPRAKRIPFSHPERFGDIREDPYFWLRDDKRTSPDVLAYLKEENEYTEAAMADTKEFREILYGELRSRIKEADMSAPLRKGSYWYYSKTEEGKQYRVYCRRPILAGEGPGKVDEQMDISTNAPPEEVLLDENSEATSHEFYLVGGFQVSPDHKLLAYGEDLDGGEHFTLKVKDLRTGTLVGTPVANTSQDLAWANDSSTLFYVTKDPMERPFKVWRHSLKAGPSEDVCVFHEKDESYYLNLGRSESGQIIFILAHSTLTSDVHYLHADDPCGTWTPVLPRVQGVDMSATHRGNQLFIVRRSDAAFNSELRVADLTDAASSLENTAVLLPNRPDIKLEGVQAFERHLAVYEREKSLPILTVYPLPPVSQPVLRLEGGCRIEMGEEAYSLEGLPSQHRSAILRFSFSSLKTPESVFDLDMNTGERSLKKAQPVLGDFDEGRYESLRRWAKASDGIRVPISIVYRKDVAKLDGSDAMLVEGYGSYEFCNDPIFSSNRLSLLDRGVLFAIAHVRGGGEMGRRWYEDAKFLRKRNSFTDLIACAEYLIAEKWVGRDKLCIEGRSAGGLLVAATVTIRPDLFRAAIAGVPFVDVLTTMLDPTLPLTITEREDWGNPEEEVFYRYMKLYSPYDNVEEKPYPNLLVTAGLYDPRVAYWEPAKWVAKIRSLKKASDKNMVLLKCDLGAGHFSKSGRFDKLQEDAFEYAFLLKSLSATTKAGCWP